ncbi:predicted protein [Histoplasma capsulatum G186AR]|uniref:Uncharacterized protein n=1 Tax=Ajellomyces capsulatus (strain G186AR / H82 / ATCC MYA-2454 / RMSCC 2432) TaxID=447093 RepID=C0NB77_AJECG|nr:uncharacterized protein HCBG_00373 [Histoplasma capsulatum G186AR]EEH10918.1 predicted protein [Histoplasma capsulatum G186AR]
MSMSVAAAAAAAAASRIMGIGTRRLRFSQRHHDRVCRGKRLYTVYQRKVSRFKVWSLPGQVLRRIQHRRICDENNSSIRVTADTNADEVYGSGNKDHFGAKGREHQRRGRLHTSALGGEVNPEEGVGAYAG